MTYYKKGIAIYSLLYYSCVPQVYIEPHRANWQAPSWPTAIHKPYGH